MNIEHPSITKMIRHGSCNEYNYYYGITGEGNVKKFKVTVVEEVQRVLEVEVYALNEENIEEVINNGDFEIIDTVEEEVTLLEIEYVEEI